MECHTRIPALVRSSELAAIVPYSMNHIRRLELAGAFPKRVRIGANRVGWVLAEIQAWIDARLTERKNDTE
jgi:prophage regulatory protein